MVMVPSLDSAFPPIVEGILQLCTVWEGLLFVGWVDDNEDFFTLSLTDVCQRILVFLCINELDGSAA